MRKTRSIILSVSMALIFGLGPLWQISPSQAQSTKVTLSEKQQKQEELLQLQKTLAKAAERTKRLQSEIAAYDKDIGAINRALIETAKRGQDLEASVTKAEGQLTESLQAQTRLQGTLNTKRALMAEVLGALQRMGRKPPPAILVRPEDALSSVRSAILLGSVVPQIRTETITLLAEMDELQAITQKVEARKVALAARLNALAEDEARLTLLVEEKNSITKRSKQELEAEKKRAEELAGKAKSLEQLIAGLETEIASAAQAAQAAREADERRVERESARLADARKKLKDGTVSVQDQTVSDTTRKEPEIAFSKARGTLSRPVKGVELYGFGSTGGTALGGSDLMRGAISAHASSNSAIATRPNARVSSPSDGWVVFAGNFRSYGKLLILNAGEGYHVVLAGLAETNVQPGQFVLAGEPVGRMGATRIASALTTDLGSNRPVLYVEFRKDGKSIDPAPWWAPQTASSTALDGSG